MGSFLKSQNPGPTTKLLNLDIQVLQRVQTTYSLKAVSLKFCPQLWLWEWWVEGTFQGHGWALGASNCPGPAHGSIGSHIFLMTSSNTTGVETIWIEYVTKPS